MDGKVESLRRTYPFQTVVVFKKRQVKSANNKKGHVRSRGGERGLYEASGKSWFPPTLVDTSVMVVCIYNTAEIYSQIYYDNYTMLLTQKMRYFLTHVLNSV